MRFGNPVELEQGLDNPRQLFEMDHIGAVAGGPIRVFVSFHEYRCDANCDSCAGQHRGEFALTAAGGALPARLLYRMGGVEDHGALGSGWP